MKTFFLFFFLLGTGTMVQAQLKYLRLSPSQTIEQTIGATNVRLAFSRPQMKGRSHFWRLVPYGQFWRTGANENTTISFDHRVQFGEVEVPAGTYALFTKPDTSQWEVYLYAETNHLDVPSPLDSDKIVAHTVVPSHQREKSEESLVINFYAVTETTARLGIQWERTYVEIPMTFFSREAMEGQIDQAITQNIADFSIAASYYLERGIELEKAKKLQEIVMELQGSPTSWAYHSYGRILFQLGEVEQAKEAIEQSLQLAREIKDAYLIRENEALLKKW